MQQAGATLRLFTALWPDPPARAAIARWQQAWEWPEQAALVKADRLHLTLHFLGNVPSARLPELVRGLRVPWRPIELSLGHGEVWTNGVASLCPETVPPALTKLHMALSAALNGLDLPLETRAYRAHVTLARRAHGAQPPPGPGLRWRIDDGYVLVQSLPAGAGYRILERFT